MCQDLIQIFYQYLWYKVKRIHLIYTHFYKIGTFSVMLTILRLFSRNLARFLHQPETRLEQKQI